MSGSDQGVIHSATEGGVSGTHPAVKPFEFLVAPSTSTEFNTARLRLIPVACWKIEHIRFAFDSSFVTSDISTELQELVLLRERHKKTDLLSRATHYPPLSIFGHADPSFEGNFEPNSSAAGPGDEFNKALSGRRATVIYALLISHSDPNKASSLWMDVARHENWGMNHRQAMQNFTGLPSSTPGPELIRAYMQKLVPKELTVTSKDFLAQGADASGKGDYQGCGRFNPRLLFSAEDEHKYKVAFERQIKDDLEKRDAANAQNRRVMVLLFRPGSKVDPAKWPCPRAAESLSGCVKRLFSDGQHRRSKHVEHDHKFDDTKDTFACRFYQRVSDRSPCEKFIELVPLLIRLFDDRWIDGHDRPFDGLSYCLEIGNLKWEGTIGDDGILRQSVPAGATSGVLKLLQQPKEGPPAALWTLTLEITDSLDSSAIAGAQARLNNLGLFSGDQISGELTDLVQRSIARFQTRYKVQNEEGQTDTSGDLTPKTVQKLKDVYGS